MNLEASGAQLLLPGADVVASPAKARRARPPATKLISMALKNAGPRGLLVEEIATTTHLPLSSVAARVGEMMRAYVVLPVERRASPRGRPAWAFALPQLLDSDARVAGRATAIQLVQHRGRWDGPVHSERAVLKAISIEAEGSDAAVNAALKFAAEILGT